MHRRIFAGITGAAARVLFTPLLRRFLGETPVADTTRATLRGAHKAAFAANPRLRCSACQNFRSLRSRPERQEWFGGGYDVPVSSFGRAPMMGSTTGGPWASVDAGDSWQTATNRLPPICALVVG